jgi:hypothetical protein
MDGMSLLDVLRGVMLDPAEQAAYNADPSAYLERFGYDDVDPADLSEAFGLVADTLPPAQAQAAWEAAATPDGDAFGAVTADFDSDNGAEPLPEPEGDASAGPELETSLSFGQGEADDGPPGPLAVEPEAGDGGATAPGESAAPDDGGSDLPGDGGLDAGYADVADDFDDHDGDGVDDGYDSGAGGDSDGDGVDDAYDSGADTDGDGITDPYDASPPGPTDTDPGDDPYDGGGFGGGLDTGGGLDPDLDDGYDAGLDDDLGDLDQIDGLDELSMPGPDDTDIGSF